MLKRLLAFSVIAAFVVLALPAFSAEKSAKPATSERAPALSAAHAAALAKLQRLAAPDPLLHLAAGSLPLLKPTAVKKEVSCGVYVFPPNPNPQAASQRLYWVNSTGQNIPAGAHIEWEVDGMPPSCCKGTTGATPAVWLPNPPSPKYFVSSGPIFAPPQPWTRPCKAWAIIP